MNFEAAFRRLNGRDPTEAEVKEALAISDIVKASDLDPVLLFFIADAKAKDERARFVAETRAIADEAVATIKAGLPTSPEWAKAAAWAAWFAKAMKAEAASFFWWMIGTSCAVAFIIVIAVVVSWREGYNSGWDSANARLYWNAMDRACASLENIRHRLASAPHYNADAVNAILYEMTQRGCK